MAINATTTRITSMYSGMDTDALVKTMMQIEQLKVDRVVRNKQKVEWKAELLKSVATDMKDFKNNYYSQLGTNSMMKQASYFTYNATVSGTNKDAVSVKAGGDASVSSVTINSITQLAEDARAVGDKVSNGAQLSANNNATLGSLDFANDLFGDSDEVSFSINGTTFTLSKDATLGDMMTAINTSDAGVTMSYSRLTDSFTITSNVKGAAGEVDIVNISGNAFGADSAFGIDPSGSHMKEGKDAILKVNGMDITRDSNTFEADGVTYTLLDTFDEASGAVKINIDRDTSPALESIKQFVSGYNTMITKIQTMITEKVAKGSNGSKYEALTEAEKEAMTEEQIEKWEELAKQGILRNDKDLQKVLDSLRSAFYDTVEGAGLSASQIGLRTSNDWKSGGTIEIDEEALTAAIAADPDAVMSVFTNIAADKNSPNAYAENGLMNRITKILDDYTQTTQYNTLESMDKDATNLAKRITEMEDRMADMEERYYAKFAAMETALAKLESQSGYLNTLLSSTSK